MTGSRLDLECMLGTFCCSSLRVITACKSADKEPELAFIIAITLCTAGEGWFCCGAVVLPRASREAEVLLSKYALIKHRPADSICEGFLLQCCCGQR
jgi:hypothetical protein